MFFLTEERNSTVSVHLGAAAVCCDRELCTVLGLTTQGLLGPGQGAGHRQCLVGLCLQAESSCTPRTPPGLQSLPLHTADPRMTTSASFGVGETSTSRPGHQLACRSLSPLSTLDQPWTLLSWHMGACASVLLVYYISILSFLHRAKSIAPVTPGLNITAGEMPQCSYPGDRPEGRHDWGQQA